MSNNYFEGYYFKHQKDNRTLVFIPGKSDDSAFIQVITNENSYNYEFDSVDLGQVITVGDCVFSKRGIKLDLPDIKGEVYYSALTPIRYDIMGPFKYLPMECRHGIISMRHRISGKLCVKGSEIDLTDGVGYIEKDSGHSFPKRYLWIECNDFSDGSSIMASVAEIPFMRMCFNGCICVIIFDGHEYRLATYLGARIVQNSESILELRQGRYALRIDVEDIDEGYPLAAPINGRMTGRVSENNRTSARFRFYIGSHLLFDLESDNASYECYGLSPDMMDFYN